MLRHQKKHAKKVNKHTLCYMCLLKDDCDFKGKDDPKAKVVDASGTYGITLECPEELGGYPVFAEFPATRKRKSVMSKKEEADDFVMISGKVFSRIMKQLKDKKIVIEKKSASPDLEDGLDNAFTKEIKNDDN